MNYSPAAPIEVLFVENSVGLSGSTMSLCTLLNYLDPNRIAPCVAVSRPEQERYLRTHLRQPVEIALIAPKPSLKGARWTRPLLAVAEAVGARTHRLCLRLLGLLDLPLGCVPYALRLRRLARRRHIVLIHQNNGFDLGALLAARLLRVPLVAYQRGSEWNSPVTRALAPRVARYMANSKTTMADLCALGVPPERIRVVYPPLDVAAFDPHRPTSLTRAALGISGPGPCFGIIGVLVPWKGQRVFLAAARRILDRVPEAWAVIVGAPPDGDVTYEEDLRHLARRLGIAERVVFAGFRGDIAPVLGLLDVVVHASVEPEPFGRVIVEAMAMRRPVVAARAGGPIEILEDGRTGFLVPPGDDGALAERVIQLLTDPLLAGRIAGLAQREVARFDAQEHVARVQAVYAEVLDLAPCDPARPAKIEARPGSDGNRR
jgi:glycosyltransferase involved in cell wall biosynthesis